MLDYKDIITKHYALGLTGSQITSTLGVSKSGVSDFLRCFENCETLSFPLPVGITNYGIAAQLYISAAAPISATAGSLRNQSIAAKIAPLSVGILMFNQPFRIYEFFKDSRKIIIDLSQCKGYNNHDEIFRIHKKFESLRKERL